jgi:hypothetical protein
MEDSVDKTPSPALQAAPTDSPVSILFMMGASGQKKNGPIRRLAERAKSAFLWLGPGFVILLVGTLFSLWLIPWISSTSNEEKLLHETRQQKILEFGEKDREFNSKLNALRTSLGRFGNMAFEMKLKPDEIKKEQMLFHKEYGDRYLALDEIAWWWYGDLEREANVLKLATPDQLSHLHGEIQQYGRSVRASVDALHPLSQYLSAAPLKADQAARDEIYRLNDALKTEIDRQREIRRELIGRISAIFAATERAYLGLAGIEVAGDANNRSINYAFQVKNFGSAAARGIEIKHRIDRVRIRQDEYGTISYLHEDAEFMPVPAPTTLSSQGSFRLSGFRVIDPDYSAVIERSMLLQVTIEIKYEDSTQAYVYQATSRYDPMLKRFFVVEGRSI